MEWGVRKGSKKKGRFDLRGFVVFFCVCVCAALGLRCCVRAFFSCGVQASHCSDFPCCETWALGAQASVVVAY